MPLLSVPVRHVLTDSGFCSGCLFVALPRLSTNPRYENDECDFVVSGNVDRTT